MQDTNTLPVDAARSVNQGLDAYERLQHTQALLSEAQAAEPAAVNALREAVSDQLPGELVPSPGVLNDTRTKAQGVEFVLRAGEKLVVKLSLESLAQHPVSVHAIHSELLQAGKIFTDACEALTQLTLTRDAYGAIPTPELALLRQFIASSGSGLSLETLLANTVELAHAFSTRYTQVVERMAYVGSECLESDQDLTLLETGLGKPMGLALTKVSELKNLARCSVAETLCEKDLYWLLTQDGSSALDLQSLIGLEVGGYKDIWLDAESIPTPEQYQSALQFFYRSNHEQSIQKSISDLLVALEALRTGMQDFTQRTEDVSLQVDTQRLAQLTTYVNEQILVLFNQARQFIAFIMLHTRGLQALTQALTVPVKS